MPGSRYLIGGITWYAALIVFGILTAIGLAMLEEKRKQLPGDTILDLALRVLPAGILGARLYYVAFNWSSFSRNPIAILYVWQGGLAIYGGLLGGGLAAWLFCRRKKLSLLRVADAVCPGILLAQAIGRWGNFFNMEAYGNPVTASAWQFFPFAVLIPEGSGFVWRQATFFYESAWNLAAFLLIWTNRKKLRQDGRVTAWCILLYAAGRQWIEGLRADSLMLGPVRVSQLLAVLLMAAAFLWLFGSRKNQRLSVIPAGGIWLLLLVGLFAPEVSVLWRLAGGVVFLLVSGLCEARRDAGCRERL